MKHKNKNWLTLHRGGVVVCLMLMIVASVQVSYALNAGSPTPVPAAEAIPEASLGPANFLQVVDGMQGTDVQILEMGSGVKQTVALGGTTTVIGGALYSGDWGKASTQRIPEFDEYEALAVQFNGSDISAANYSMDTDAGWNAQDLSLDTTTMWIKIKYSNAGYYKGELVDAVATIKVTPYKNRTVGASWANFNYSNKVYYPMIQLSELLYNGWCWQNVGEFNVDLEFYKKGATAPVVFPSSAYTDTSGVYYTLNSLNPAKTFVENSSGTVVTTLTGPEYVWPKSGTFSHAYVVENSNIKLDYNGDSEGVQYAYNGGTNHWGSPWNASQDDPTSPDWNLNSAMFTTANTNNINFTLGLMERDPYDINHVKRTSYMWASFSTASFSGKTVSYIDIPVSKVWVNAGSDQPERVTVDLYQEWTDSDWADTASIHSEKVQTVVLDDANDWSGSFKYVPVIADLAEKLGVETDQVRYTAKEVEVPGYTATYPIQNDGSIVVQNKKINPTTPAKINIKKIVTGEPKTDETFTFALTPDEDTFPMPEGGDGKEEITITGNGTGSFGTWTYTKAGVYTYQVREVAGSHPLYIYDNTTYIITDTVTLNGNGDLEVSRSVQTGTGETIEGPLTFNNQYQPGEEFPGSPENPDKPDGGTPIRTGDPSQSSLFFLLMTMSLTILILLAVSSRTNLKKQ